MFLPYRKGEKGEQAATSQQAVLLVADVLPLAWIQLQTRHKFGGSSQACVKPLPSIFHPLPRSSLELGMITEMEDHVRAPLKTAMLKRSFWQQFWPLFPYPMSSLPPPTQVCNHELDWNGKGESYYL